MNSEDGSPSPRARRPREDDRRRRSERYQDSPPPLTSEEKRQERRRQRLEARAARSRPVEEEIKVERTRERARQASYDSESDSEYIRRRKKTTYYRADDDGIRVTPTKTGLTERGTYKHDSPSYPSPPPRAHQPSSPEKRRRGDERYERERDRRRDFASREYKSRRHASQVNSTDSTAGLLPPPPKNPQKLNLEALTQLNEINEHYDKFGYVPAKKRRRKYLDVWSRVSGRNEDDEKREFVEEKRERRRKEEKTRVVSLTKVEKNYHSDDDRGGSGGNGRRRWRWSCTPSFGFWRNASLKKKRLIVLGVGLFLVLIIAIPLGVVVSQRNGSSNSTTSSNANNSNLNSVSPSTIPASAQGTYLDPFTWYDTVDFNLTYTNATVGGLYIMGLNSTWDDTVQANANVPPLNQKFQYGTMPIRGINVGGWFSLEPFITPSLFNSYSSTQGIIDEWTLTSYLGPTQAAKILEQHYSTFINAASFSQIRAAGFDHVRIPYSYWAVTTYPDDPYVPMISWRYLLRAIEYCRQNGLRVNLDLHGIPGSQNGWNHSGRQGVIGWLNGTDGDLNAQRSLDIHNQLSTFFAQPRYRNVIGIYGLVNEPKMIALPTDKVLNWTTSAIDIVRNNNLTQLIAIGDGFLGLPNWQGKLTNVPNVVLDAHNYVIFNNGQIAFTHQVKLNYACSGWSGQMRGSINTATGFGPTMCGEWSQADTDCATYLNNVNTGSRWTGTLNLGNASQNVLTPQCPTASSKTCECNDANANPSSYSDEYKTWLLMNAEAQMTSFEIGYGWFYWTWKTESAVQWSYMLALEAGIVPQQVYTRSFNCTTSVPDFGSLGLSESY